MYSEWPIQLVVLQPTANNEDRRPFEHLGVAYIAAALREKGFQVHILDQNLTRQSLEEVIDEVQCHEPELIGISGYQLAYEPLQQFIHQIKKDLPRAHISLGGVFATNSSKQIAKDLQELDSLILGEGETTFVKLAQSLLRGDSWGEIPGIVVPNDPNSMEKKAVYESDLNILPMPARDTLPLVLKRGLYPLVSTSRGCYGRCSYCSIAAQKRPRRLRDIELVLDEVAHLQTDFGAEYFYFIDDTFIGASRKERQRIENFAKLVIERKMKIRFSFECRANEVDRELFLLLKKAGLHQVFLGIESGYQPTLDLFKKGIGVQDNLKAIKLLQELGILYRIGFLMFHPYTDLQEVAANLEFLLQTDQQNLLNSIKNKLVIYHNTPIAKKIKEDGLHRGRWYDIDCEFLYPEIDPLYEFVLKFHFQIKPKMDLIIRKLKETTSRKMQKQLQKRYAQLGSALIETMFSYIDSPKIELLDQGYQRVDAILRKEEEQLTS